MKLLVICFTLTVFNAVGSVFSQITAFNFSYDNVSLGNVLQEIEDNSEYKFLYRTDLLDLERTISLSAENYNVEELLDILFSDEHTSYRIFEDNLIAITTNKTGEQQITVSGQVTDAATGEPLPGATIIIKDTTTGTIADGDGNYSIEVPSPESILVIAYVGYESVEVIIGERRVIDISLRIDILGIEEVVMVGYGAMRKSDLTGSVIRADLETFRGSPNVSIMQSLQGSVPGLTIGQVDRSGQAPGINIRGQASISGEQAPLIVVDDVIFRGNLIDLNPNDIASIDILKDASAAAIYGSQATNGVILISTTRDGGVDGKPTIRYSSFYATRSPINEFRPGTHEDYLNSLPYRDLHNAFTAESWYTEPNPDWSVSTHWKCPRSSINYAAGIYEESWYDLVINDHMYTQNHNLSVSNRTETTNYMISLGFIEEVGYMINDDFTRLNARINIDNNITDWLQIGIQSFVTASDHSGRTLAPSARYNNPYSPARDPEGELYWRIMDSGANPFYATTEIDENKRNHFFGNIYALVDIPFIRGLSYRLNFGNNYRTTRRNYYRDYIPNFQGTGYKSNDHRYEYTMDNIVSLKRRFNDIHNLDVTLVYGLEERTSNYTTSEAEYFINHVLGYHSLQSGQSDLQRVSTGAWEEASLYSMARLFYGYNQKYLFTGTIRRDGFSGFSEEYKFGLFPSASFAWVVSEESFIGDDSFLNYLKLRASYGSTGNRTIGRYQTLARVGGTYGYIDENHNSMYTQSITSLASPNLKWETTTGVNLGFDFGILGQRLFGSIDYYNNNTTNLLYNVDIPGISRFENFPDNLGKLHNHGLELNISSINLDRADFNWRSTIIFSRNRNELKSLLGFDNTGDGKEDDLISEGLFIGEPLDAIYTYETTGEKWQIGDDIPPGYDIGVNKVVDQNGDGIINADDKVIIGYAEPSYRFGITNTASYKNWRLSFFINSVQGGKNRYLAADHARGFAISNQHVYLVQLPLELDYWTPQNPNARYQRPWTFETADIRGDNYVSRSFVRLQDIMLSYQFPGRLMDRYGLQNLRLYFNGKNLLTFTNWPGWDPETGIGLSYGGLPVMKSYTFGLEIEF